MFFLEYRSLGYYFHTENAWNLVLKIYCTSTVAILCPVNHVLKLGHVLVIVRVVTWPDNRWPWQGTWLRVVCAGELMIHPAILKSRRNKKRVSFEDRSSSRYRLWLRRFKLSAWLVGSFYYICISGLGQKLIVAPVCLSGPSHRFETGEVIEGVRGFF
jgi:hypothetical protein